MDRKIPRKNYIIYAVIVVVTLLVVLYLNEWYKAYKQKQLDESYIAKYVNKVSYEEFKNLSLENPNLIVYIGKTNCSECIKLEKELYKIINKNDLTGETIFLDTTNLNSLDVIKNEYGLANTNYNYSVPSIAILKDSKITDVLTSENNTITEDLIVQLLEEYEYIK